MPGRSDRAGFDDSFRDLGCGSIAGIDEAGRGPLAGPVVAAAVVLGPGIHIPGARDSKRLTEAARARVFTGILLSGADASVGMAWQDEIDAVNIRVASLLAMARAVRGLATPPSFALADGKDLPSLPCPGVALVGGDDRSESIAAASIVAKVVRDALMTEFHSTYPEYGFDRHKGYPTPEHLARLAELGPCPLHRLTFSGVRAADVSVKWLPPVPAQASIR